MQILCLLLSLLFTLTSGANAREEAVPCPQSTPVDSVFIGEQQDESVLADLDKFFSPFTDDIDTFAWDVNHINSGRFNSSTWADTAHIALVDPIRHRFYVHPCNGNVTSNFGQRDGVWHFGVDIKLQTGDSVPVALDGMVRVIQYDRRGYGHVVVVRNYMGIETIYGHLSKVVVKPNQVIKAGDIVGLGGNTGRSSGSHLHFEMRYYGEPFDPSECIDFTTFNLKNDTITLTKANFAYLVEMRKAVWHTVSKGETLGHLASRYHTSIGAICSLNSITVNTALKIGKKILIRKDGAPATADEPSVLNPRTAWNTSG
jgi:hypothetical protein